ncbi:MAG: hypothetical protein R3E79_19335 [Caldilineaceae bacterium]
MVALLTDEARAQAAVAPYAATVAVAAVNGPTSVVISGKTADVQAIAAQLASEGVKIAPLPVSLPSTRRCSTRCWPPLPKWQRAFPMPRRESRWFRL